MTLFVNSKENLKEYNQAIVYLKNIQPYKVTVPGKIVSVETDNYSIKIQTETNLAVFDTQDVAAVTFQK